MTVFSLPATPLASPTGLVDSLKPAPGAPADSPSFAQMLENAFGQVNALQGHSAQMAQAFAQGRTSDVHSVMIAAEQATMALQLTTQIRNKAVDAYQEIMRISM
jgi:flagellar hook-basal body complex protein FliE